MWIGQIQQELCIGHSLAIVTVEKKKKKKKESRSRPPQSSCSLIHILESLAVAALRGEVALKL